MPDEAMSAVLLASASASGLSPSTTLTTCRKSKTPKHTALAPRVDLPSFLQALFPAVDVPLRDKLFLNVKEAVRYSRLPQSTIRHLIHANKPPAVKAGGWRIKRSDLEQLDLTQLRDLSDKPV